MLYHLLFSLSDELSAFNVFRYITFRSFFAFLLSVSIVILVGKKFIIYIKYFRRAAQSIRDDGPKSHKQKEGTPTFGGLLILLSIFASILVCGNFFSLPLLGALYFALTYGFVGFLDDYLKVKYKNSKGVSGRTKLFWQFLLCFMLFFPLYLQGYIDGLLYVPFLKNPILDLGYAYPLFASFVVVGSSNAVNLTDGLDGLVTGPVLTSATTLGILAYLGGNIYMASYLYIPFIEGAGELSVLMAATIGAGVGFLWFNSYPAEIFMGDVGSLALGGILGAVSVFTKNEILFILIGGIFVIEALSVILQVASFKVRKKRILKMAPLHHHFELKGWPEPKVIVRFWIFSLILAILSLATIKLR